MLRATCVALPRHFRGRYLKPTQLARTLFDGKEIWCKACHRQVERKHWDAHTKTHAHLICVRKLHDLKVLSLEMWAQHRKAPIDDESGKTEALEKEFELFKRSQQQRETPFR